MAATSWTMRWRSQPLARASRPWAEQNRQHSERFLEATEHAREVAHVGLVLSGRCREPGSVVADGLGNVVEGFGGDDLKEAEDVAAVLLDVRGGGR